MSHPFSLVALAGLVLAGFATGTHREAAPDPNPLPPDATLIYPKGPADGLLWPHQNSRVWSINRLDPTVKGEVLTLEIRTKHEPWEGGVPNAQQLISKADSEKTVLLKGVRSSEGIQPTTEVKVAVQVIDLGHAAMPTGKDSLRLLASLQIGAGITYHSGKKSVLEGKYEGSWWVNNLAKWKNGEMHLYNLFVQEKDQLATYCFVLVQSK